MSTEPKPACSAAHWRYNEIKPLLTRTAREVDPSEAERRVLLLHNPGLKTPFATHTLGCGLQILLGGEIEGKHRHTPSALRLVIEGDGGYTTTDGERMWMKPGDVITTPSWTWHDHGKVTDGEMIWLDGIDVPLINHLHLNFTEYGLQDQRQELTVADEDSHYRYGSGLAPLSGVPVRPFSPIYYYPYSRTREILGALAREGEWDTCHALKMRLTNPLTGGNFMPTIAGFMQLLPSGFSSAPVRSTDAAIYSVVEGTGKVSIGDECFSFNQHDVFVTPNWTDIRFDCEQETVLFSYSDRAMQENLSLWRERRGDV
ncbi:cupin domain-containing protein [Erythrobacter westpacificensis]